MPQTSPPTVRRRTARLEIDSDCARIAPTVNELTRDLRDLGWINEQVCYEVTLALTEALSNAVLHGNLEIASDVRERGIKSMLELAECSSWPSSDGGPSRSRRAACASGPTAGRTSSST
jgi:hypothetical protein